MVEKKSKYTRREALRAMSLVGMVMVSSRWSRAALTPVVPAGHAKLAPELTEGPFYITLERIRRDITEGKPGVPLRLKFRVVNAMTGAAIPGAAVDVWHCDAQGKYSGFAKQAEMYFHGPPHGQPHSGDPHLAGPFPAQAGAPDFPPLHKPDNAETFLRGVQLTDARGAAEIATIFPGWYAGRTTHIHVRVHVGGSIAGNRYEGGHISHTGQLFFPEAMTDEIYGKPAYARSQRDRMRQDADGIFAQDGRLITPLRALDPARLAQGVVAEPVLVVDPAATPPRAGMMMG
jgi:protocatechuate 3,4-dioxygenase beta subunit